MEALRARVAEGLILPLDESHFIEHLKAGTIERRRRLAWVFDLFSRGWHISSWDVIVPTEISRAVAHTFGTAIMPPPPEVFGRGYLSGQTKADFPPHYSDAEFISMRQDSEQPGALFDLLTETDEEGRSTLSQAIAECGERNAASAERVRAARKPYSRKMQKRGQLVTYILQEQLHILAALAALGRSPGEFLSIIQADGLEDFWSRVPSLDVDGELTLYRDRQSRKVKSNDFHDIRHLATALPYCDVVVVEKFWARAIKETGLGTKYETVVCSDLAELMGILE